MIDDIVPNIQKTADLVQEIASASIEQKNNLQQLNIVMNNLSNLAGQNAASSEQLSATGEGLKNQSIALKDTLALFKLNQ